MNVRDFAFVLLFQIGCIACVLGSSGSAIPEGQSSAVVGIEELLSADGCTQEELLYVLANVYSKNSHMSMKRFISNLDSVLTLYCEDQCRIEKNHHNITKGEQ
jgi:hypothetical protein